MEDDSCLSDKELDRQELHSGVLGLFDKIDLKKAIQDFTKELKKELCIDKDEECLVNKCGSRDNVTCGNCEKIDKLNQKHYGEKLIKKEKLK